MPIVRAQIQCNTDSTDTAFPAHGLSLNGNLYKCQSFIGNSMSMLMYRYKHYVLEPSLLYLLNKNVLKPSATAILS